MCLYILFTRIILCDAQTRSGDVILKILMVSYTDINGVMTEVVVLAAGEVSNDTQLAGVYVVGGDYRYDFVTPGLHILLLIFSIIWLSNSS